MAQPISSSNPLDGFLSAVQSIATEFAPSTATTSISSSATSATSASSTTPSSSASSTSSAVSSSVVSSTPTAAAAASSSSSANAGIDKGTRDTIIIICTVLGTLLLALIALGIWLCLRRRKKRRARGDEIEGKAIASPSQVDDWYHGNNSHHGYVGAGAAKEETTQHGGYAKAPRHSISQLDEDVNGPDIADHPAFSPGDPYTAAGVGARGTSGTPRSRERSAPDGEITPARRSLGERRYSGKMPARKPVGSASSISSRHRDSNPLRIDTSDAAVGAGIGVGAAALAGSAVEHHKNRRLSRDSHSYARRSDPFVSPTQLPDPTAPSPLSSHPSNPLLYGQGPNKRDSYRSRKSSNGSLHGASAIPSGKSKRPQTPLGFDFGLPRTSHAAETHSTTQAQYHPLTSDFEAQPSDSHEFEPQVLTSGLDAENAPAAQLPQQHLDRDHSVPESQPLIAAVSRFSNSSHHGAISSPTPAQSASLQRRSLHFLDQHQRAPAPEVPERSPHRLSRSSFDEPATHWNSHTPPYATTEDLSVPPRSPKRASWNRSRENVNPTNTLPSRNDFLGSNDPAYLPPSLGHDGSPRHSPRIGPALGHRSRERQRTHSLSNADIPVARTAYSYGNDRSPVFGAGRDGDRDRDYDRHIPDHGYGHPVYGPGDSGAASSVESWVSARAIPTPWEDNAIRRNSSSGNLRRPDMPKETSSSSSGGGGGGGGEKAATSQRRLSAGTSFAHRAAAQNFSGHDDLRDEKRGNEAGLRGDGHGDSGYYGPGGYDASWGESNVENPIFEKYGAPQSRRRSGSSGFDPRYGRWTDTTFDEVYGDGHGHGHGHGVGEAI